MTVTTEMNVTTVNTVNTVTARRPARRPATAVAIAEARAGGGGEWPNRVYEEVQGDGSFTTSTDSDRRPPLRDTRSRRQSIYPPPPRGRTRERLDAEVEEYRARREAQLQAEEEEEEEHRRRKPRPERRWSGSPRGSGGPPRESGGDRAGPPRESGGDRGARPPKHWKSDGYGRQPPGEGYGRSPPYSKVTLSVNEKTRRSREQGPPSRDLSRTSPRRSSPEGQGGANRPQIKICRKGRGVVVQQKINAQDRR